MEKCIGRGLWKEIPGGSVRKRFSDSVSVKVDLHANIAVTAVGLYFDKEVNEAFQQAAILRYTLADILCSSDKKGWVQDTERVETKIAQRLNNGADFDNIYWISNTLTRSPETSGRRESKETHPIGMAKYFGF